MSLTRQQSEIAESLDPLDKLGISPITVSDRESILENFVVVFLIDPLRHETAVWVSAYTIRSKQALIADRGIRFDLADFSR